MEKNLQVWLPSAFWGGQKKARARQQPNIRDPPRVRRHFWWPPRRVRVQTRAAMRRRLFASSLLLLLLRLLSASEDDDVYYVLGVDESASDREVINAQIHQRLHITQLKRGPHGNMHARCEFISQSSLSLSLRADQNRVPKLSLKHHPDKRRRRGRLQTDLRRAFEVLSDGRSARCTTRAAGARSRRAARGTAPVGSADGRSKGRRRLGDGDRAARGHVCLAAACAPRVAAARCVPRMRGQAGPPRPYAGGDGREVPWLPASCPPEKKVVQRRMGMMIMNQEVEEPSKELQGGRKGPDGDDREGCGGGRGD